MKNNQHTTLDEQYMRRALRLAGKGECMVSPNPMVGAVIVKGKRTLGEGYHRCCGEAHAEINALKSATESIHGATIYVTLEPCSHHGKTPPCVNALIAARPARVVIGTRDPNPLVSGRGIKSLQKNGIDTTVGILEEECRQQNECFFKFMETGLPFVTVKFAQTMDGRIATATGHSRWISSPPSLKYAHKLRSCHDAILVGAGTIIKDNPELTVRLVRGNNPVRIVVDKGLITPLDAHVIKNQNAARTIIATTGNADRKKASQLQKAGIEIISCTADSRGRIDLNELLGELGKKNITSVLVEGGASIITSFVQKQLADRLVVVIAPKIVGKGIEAVGDLAINSMDEALRFSFRKIIRKGDDLIIDTRPVK